MRPRIMGTHGVVSSGHYLATMAGIEAFRRGGNAFDAGVAAAMALKVTKMGYAGWTGVAPLILYSAGDGEIITRVGAGTTPAKATLEYFQDKGKTDINMALLPADVDVWLAALDRYGTFSFEEAARAALEVAEGGYHLYKHQKHLLDDLEEGIQRFPYNVQFWFQHGVGKQAVGDLMANPDLGRLIRTMSEAEQKVLASGGTRSEGIRAARDAFYKGDPARAAAAFYAKFEDGLVTYDDLAGYEGKWMEARSTRFRDYDVFVCDGWSQGPRMILFLNMLESFDLEALGYNTPEYIHILSQIINLGMSDSHKYVGDPDFVDIPKALYSKEYARKRVELIDRDKAFSDMPPWGDPAAMKGVAVDSPRVFAQRKAASARPIEDTTSLNVMDSEGNLFSMTESDGHMVSPMIPGWGFGLGRRMEQLNLNPALANVMAPKKRPRNTNTPIIVMKDGKPFMGLSTPGGEQQLQAILQVFLNVVVWRMSPEQALDQPRFGSYNFPITGHEVNENPGKLCLEERIPRETFDALEKLGHRVESWGLWNWRTGAVTVTYRDPKTGVLIAAGDVRRETSALGY
jgi:gamma-glutamyltranspeptidase/glutathione hydrolase